MRAKYFPDLGPVNSRTAADMVGKAARRHLSPKNRVQAARHFLQLGRIRRETGQLAYAAAVLVAPSVAERRLERIEPRTDPEWAALAEPWLGGVVAASRPMMFELFG